MTIIKRYNPITSQWEKAAEEPVLASNNQIIYQNAIGAKTGSPDLTFDGTTLSATALVSNSLTVDTNTLYVDATNDRVGIGTASPLTSLHVEGTFPNSTLFSGPSSFNGNVIIKQSSTQAATHSKLSFFTNYNGTSQIAAAIGSYWGPVTSGFLIFGTSSNGTHITNEALTINSAGNATFNGSVGIGTYSPTEKLDVVGNAKVSGTMVVGGNLTVNGTTTTINSTTVTIDDPIFTLGGDAAPTIDDNKDRGIEFRWHNGTSAKVGFFGLDDSTGKFIFIPDATNTSEVFSGTKGTIDANLEWADVLNKPTLFNWDTPQTLSAKTASYTLLTADVGTAVTFDSATAVNCTIDGSLDLTPGQRIDVIQLGSGQVTFVASSATVNATPGLKMRARYSAATIICVATDSYVVVGDLSA